MKKRASKIIFVLNESLKPSITIYVYFEINGICGRGRKRGPTIVCIRFRCRRWFRFAFIAYIALAKGHHVERFLVYNFFICKRIPLIFNIKLLEYKINIVTEFGDP